MDFKAAILILSILSSTLSAEVTTDQQPHHDGSADKKSVPLSHPDKPVVHESEAVHDPVQGKTLLDKSTSGTGNNEMVKLFRHDINAGVYRTEGGDLVRMYRVEKVTNPLSLFRRAAGPAPVTKKRDGLAPSDGEGSQFSPRLIGDWLGGSYSYGSSYNYPYYSSGYNGYYNNGYNGYYNNGNYGYNNPYGYSYSSYNYPYYSNYNYGNGLYY